MDPEFYTSLLLFQDAAWAEVSQHAKDFIEHLLQARPLTRLRARQGELSNAILLFFSRHQTSRSI
jgi:hypothetical protein